ncbi:MAG: tetratricopeptide repeat protein [candidate division Zixibacteria bacterium]|nr:tetratricopeptide repeat protein [candidate division Zixibacteria bacterium]
MDYQKAAEYRKQLEENPQDIELLREASGFFTSNGFYEIALDYLSKLNEIDPGDVETLKTLGAMEGKFGDLHSARDYLEEALNLSPEDPDIHYNLGLTLLNLGETDKAIECLQKTVNLKPDDEIAWNDLGVLYFSLNMPSDAEDCFYRAIESNAGYRQAYHNLAQLKDKYAEPQKALSAFKYYLTRNDDQAIHSVYEQLRSTEADNMAGEGFAGLKVCLVAFSDMEQDKQRRLRWGDYWFKKEFAEAFERLGCEIVEDDADLLLHLFGIPVPELPDAKFKAIWIHSHPDLVSPQLLSNYDKVFCLSKPFIPKLAAMGHEAELLVGATAKLPVKSGKKYDIVFVGNTKGKDGRKIISDLQGRYEGLKVWGEGWDSILPAENIGGIYYDNRELPELYASTKISLNDHHEDMRREGFLNPRVFDILASGGFVISDKMVCIEEIFGDTVPTYSTPEELKALIEKYLNDDQAREELAAKGRQISLKYSFDNMAKQALSSIYGNDSATGISLNLKQGEEYESASNNPNKIRIGMNIQDQQEREVTPILNAIKLVQEHRPELELRITGQPAFDPEGEQLRDENSKWVNNLGEIDLFIDSRLGFSKASNRPADVPLVLSTNLLEDIWVESNQLFLKVDSRLDLEQERVWSFNDLAFKITFAIDNYDLLINEKSGLYEKQV